MPFDNIAYIALGANLHSPQAQLKRALATIDAHPQCSLIQSSSLYLSTPLGPPDQSDYINAVASVNTSLTPQALLKVLQAIELQQGRVRKEQRWGPRTLDLDILLYNADQIESENLTVPHYDMNNRNFVLLPLFEIAPQLTLPDGTALSKLVESVEKKGIKKL